MMKKILLAVAVLVCALSFTACCCTEDATACTDEAAPAAAETPVETLDPAKAPVVDLIDKSVFDACMAKDAQVPEDLVKD
ncbi:MAG: hypothetical protein J6Q65_06865, partial [Lentisphaeria bacterium]|nr:hypothetical protein [Lentisphaeria bacterium]